MSKPALEPLRAFAVVESEPPYLLHPVSPSSKPPLVNTKLGAGVKVEVGVGDFVAEGDAVAVRVGLVVALGNAVGEGVGVRVAVGTGVEVGGTSSVVRRRSSMHNSASPALGVELERNANVVHG